MAATIPKNINAQHPTRRQARSTWHTDIDPDLPDGYVPHGFKDKPHRAGYVGTKQAKISQRYNWLQPVHLELIQYYASDGMSLNDIAKKLQITVRQLEGLIKTMPEVGEAIQFGKDRLVARVESGLIKAALGMSCKDYRKTTYFNGQGELVTTKIEEREYDVPPNVEAIKMFLFTRAKDRYSKDTIQPIEDRSINITIKKADSTVAITEQDKPFAVETPEV